MSREVRDAIGRRLKEAREQRRQTQQQLAKILGLSRQMVNRYENGHDAPTAENLLKLLRHFGIGIAVPGYAHTLTAEALEIPSRGPRLVPRQLTLELNKPHELPNATVRIVPRQGSIEIVISGVALGGRTH